MKIIKNNNSFYLVNRFNERLSEDFSNEDFTYSTHFENFYIVINKHKSINGGNIVHIFNENGKCLNNTLVIKSGDKYYLHHDMKTYIINIVKIDTSRIRIFFGNKWYDLEYFLKDKQINSFTDYEKECDRILSYVIQEQRSRPKEYVTNINDRFYVIEEDGKKFIVDNNTYKQIIEDDYKIKFTYNYVVVKSNGYYYYFNISVYTIYDVPFKIETSKGLNYKDIDKYIYRNNKLILSTDFNQFLKENKELKHTRNNLFKFNSI